MATRNLLSLWAGPDGGKWGVVGEMENMEFVGEVRRWVRKSYFLG